MVLHRPLEQLVSPDWRTLLSLGLLLRTVGSDPTMIHGYAFPFCNFAQSEFYAAHPFASTPRMQAQSCSFPNRCTHQHQCTAGQA